MLQHMRLGSCGSLALMCAIQCTSADVPRVALDVYAGVPVDLAVGPYQSPIRCDSDGNLYIRAYENSRPLATPIIKIGRNGKVATNFSFDAIGDLGTKDLQALDFAVGDRGDVYALVSNKKGSYIVEFRQNGEFTSALSLPFASDFQVSRFVRLPSGQLLVTGLEGKQREPRTVLLYKDGRMSKVLDTKQSLQLDDTAKISKEDLFNFEMSELTVGEDGNIYIMRPSQVTTILVFSPLGEVVNKLVIEPPGAEYFPVTMKVNGGKILVVFEEHKEGLKGSVQSILRDIYRVVDARTGLAQIDYIPGHDLWEHSHVM